MRIVATVAACLLIVALIGNSEMVHADDWTIPSGSVWTYSYLESVHTPQLHLALNGTLEDVCVGLTTLTLSDEEAEVLTYYTLITADVTGAVLSDFGNWAPLTGELVTSMLEYFDPGTGTPVRTVFNQKLDMGSLYYEEHNDTHYTDVIIQPPDIYSDFYSGSLPPGTEWTVVYVGTVSVDGVENTKSFDWSCDLRSYVNRTYVGNETIDVTAGIFACKKVLSEYADSTTEEWYSSVARGNAKVAVHSEEDSIVWSLIEYELHEETIGGQEHDLNPAILLAAVAIVIAVMAMTLMLFIRRQKRPPECQGKLVPPK